MIGRAGASCDMRSSSADGPPPSVRQIAAAFARYANFTLGGGSATTAVIHGEIVDRRRWVRGDQFALSFALGRITPGTNLLAFCTATGWFLQRLPGALVALLAASIPCALTVIVVTALFSELSDSPIAHAALEGAIAAAVGITVKTCWTIAGPYFRSGRRLQVVLIAGAAFLLHAVLALPAIDVLLLAGAIGIVLPTPRP